MANKLSGKVTMPKELMDYEFVTDEPACRGRAFLDLWFLANDRARTEKFNGRDVVLKRGQLAWAQTSLAKRWRKSPEWVRQLLVELQDAGRITFEPSKTTTIITVIDYTVYNPDSGTETATETASDSASESVSETATETGTETATESAQKWEVGSGKVLEGGRPDPGRGNALRAGSQQQANGASIVIPSDQEVREFCAAYKDLSRGIENGIPEVWWTGWLASRLNAASFPRDWKRVIALAFTADFIARHPKALAGVVPVSSPGITAPSRTPAQARFELSRELEEVRARLDARYELNLEPLAEDVDLEKKLRAELEKSGSATGQ